jgi:hypothetical protein
MQLAAGVGHLHLFFVVVGTCAFFVTCAQLCRSPPTGMLTKRDRPDTNSELLFQAYSASVEEVFHEGSPSRDVHHWLY